MLKFTGRCLLLFLSVIACLLAPSAASAQMGGAMLSASDFSFFFESKRFSRLIPPTAKASAGCTPEAMASTV